MIKGLNGQPFVLKGSMQEFDPDNQDHALFDRFDQEIIRFGGSPIEYYEIFIQEQTIDPVYLEDRGKLWSNFPITLWGYYEPPEQQNPSTIFGIDTPDEEIVIECNYKSVQEAIGHPPKRGSRIFTPHRQENWIIIDTKLTQFKLWSLLHIALHCRKFQESTTTGEGNASQARPDFMISDNP